MSDPYTAALGGKGETVLQYVGQDPSLLSRPSPGGMFKGYTLLHCAAVKNHVELANALLQRGASTTLRDPKGRTAGDLAMEKGFHALAALLRAAGPSDVPTTHTAAPQHAHRAAHLQAGCQSHFQPAAAPAHPVYNGFAAAGMYGAGPGSSLAANARMCAGGWPHHTPTGGEYGEPSEDISCADAACDVPAAPTQLHTQLIHPFAFSQPHHPAAMAPQPFAAAPPAPGAHPQVQHHAQHTPQHPPPPPPAPALHFQPPPQQQQQQHFSVNAAAVPLAASAAERWASLEAVLLSSVRGEAVAAAVPRPALGSLLGPDNARIVSICQEHQVKVDIDHVDADASAVRIVRPATEPGAAAARQAAAWRLLEAVPDGLLCGAALPVAEPLAARMGDEILAEAVRLSAGARISLHPAPGTGRYLVITGPAAAARLALLLLLRDALDCPAAAGLEAHSCAIYPSDLALASSALAARAPHARLLRVDTTAASPPAAHAAPPAGAAADTAPVSMSLVAAASALPGLAVLLAEVLPAARPAPIFRRLCLRGSVALGGPAFSVGSCRPAVHAVALRVADSLPTAELGPALATLERPLSRDEAALLRSAPLNRLRHLQCARDGGPPPPLDPRELRWVEEAMAETARALADPPNVSGAEQAQSHPPAQPALSFAYDPTSRTEHVSAAGPAPAPQGNGAVEVAHASPAGGKDAVAAASGEGAGGAVDAGVASSSESESSESESAGVKRKKRKREKRERKKEKKEKRKRERRERTV